jgi:hypothetical protein
MFYGYDRHKKMVFGLDIIIKSEHGFLGLAFTEVLPETVSFDDPEEYLLEKKDYYLDWASVFLSAYTWTGYNQQPEPTQFAT